MGEGSSPKEGEEPKDTVECSDSAIQERQQPKEKEQAAASKRCWRTRESNPAPLARSNEQC
jgi:hypothetical protein